VILKNCTHSNNLSEHLLGKWGSCRRATGFSELLFCRCIQENSLLCAGTGPTKMEGKEHGALLAAVAAIRYFSFAKNLYLFRENDHVAKLLFSRSLASKRPPRGWVSIMLSKFDR